MFKKRHASAEFKPGTLVIPKGAPLPVIKAILYSPTNILEKVIEINDISKFAEELSELTKHQDCNLWLDVQGLGSEDILLKIADIFGLHLLTIADVVNIPQRPKAENLESHYLFIGAMLEQDSQGKIEIDQLSVIWGKNFVLTFQEYLGDNLDPVRNRLRSGKGQMRKSRCDYLAYAIIDATIDGYYPILEGFGDELELLGEELIKTPDKEILQRIYKAKRELLKIRKIIWPQREALNSMARDEISFIKKETRVYFRDTYDHVIQLIDVVETYREFVSGFIDIYLSSTSMKMNEIMKLLTVIGTIFIPLSFFSSIYGMNFEFMPELHYKYSYLIFWICMIIITSAMLFYFQKKGWLFGDNRDQHD